MNIIVPGQIRSIFLFCHKDSQANLFLRQTDTASKHMSFFKCITFLKFSNKYLDKYPQHFAPEYEEPVKFLRMLSFSIQVMFYLRWLKLLRLIWSNDTTAFKWRLFFHLILRKIKDILAFISICDLIQCERLHICFIFDWIISWWITTLLWMFINLSCEFRLLFLPAITIFLFIFIE